MAKADGSLPSYGLTLLRVFMGALLAVQGWRWMQSGGMDAGAFQRSVEAGLPRLHGSLQWWAEHVLLQSPRTLGLVWSGSALLVGVLFVLGALVRPAGLFAVLVLAHGIVFGALEQRLLFLSLAVIALACSISSAGRRLGLDAIFDQHFPAWVTWTRRGSSSGPA